MSAAIIELTEVRKIYRTSEVETAALAGVSMAIQHADFLAITGPSGCGKSTLLNILGLLDYADSGSVRVDGFEVGRGGERTLAALRRGTVGFVFQSFNLIEELSVVENVEMPLSYLGVSRRDRRERALGLLERVDLSHRAGHRPSQLSGGQQQRVAIARALVPEPKLVLADEPTGNLDTENGRLVMGLLERLPEQGTAVVVVTHDAAIADQAPRRIAMRDGRVVDADSR